MRLRPRSEGPDPSAGQDKGSCEVSGLGAAPDCTDTFRLTAVDGARMGGGAPDTLRMKIVRDDVVLGHRTRLVVAQQRMMETE